MSAWMCSRKHIATLATFAAQNVYVCKREGMTPAEIADILKQANMKSLDVRYGKNNGTAMGDMYGTKDIKPYKALDFRGTFGVAPVQIIKLAHSFDYQSCEDTEGYPTSRAKELIDAIIDQAITMLDGYDAAAWSI